MFDKEITKRVLESIVRLNNKMGVWAFIIPIIFAFAVLFQLYHAYKKPSVKNSRLLTGILMMAINYKTIFKKNIAKKT